MSTSRMKKPECKLVSIFSDPMVSCDWNSSAKKSSQVAVEEAVGAIYHETVQRATVAYNIKPPLDHTKFKAMLFPDAPANQKLADVGSELVVVIRPGDADQQRLKEKVKYWKHLEVKSAEIEREPPTPLVAEPELAKGKSRNKGNKGSKKSAKTESQSSTENATPSLNELWELVRKQEVKHQEEVSELRTTIEDLKVSNRRLENDVQRLENDVQRLENDNHDLRNEVKSLKTELRDSLDSLRRVTAALTPIHLRHLLDMGRIRIIQHLASKSSSKIDSWDTLVGGRTVDQLSRDLFSQLNGVPHRPSVQALMFLCSSNQVRREGNEAAHTAEPEEIRDAVTSKSLDSNDRSSLEQIFKFVFGYAI